MRKSAAVFMASTLLSLGACAVNDPGEDTATASSELRTADGQYRRDTLSRGSGIDGTNGVRIGADGNLYVASFMERAVVVLNPRNGKEIRRLGTAQGVETPDDIAFGPDGSLYFTSFLTGEVGRILPSGEKRTVAQLGPGANAIAFSGTGRLFVSRVFLGDELYELDPEGVAAPRVVATGLYGANAFEFGSDGQLYAPIWFLGQVQKIDPDTGARTVVASGVGTPSSARFNAAGKLFALDYAGGRFLGINPATGVVTVIASGEALKGADNFDFDAKGNALVSNAHNGTILEVSPKGKVSTVLGGNLSFAGGVAAIKKHGKETVFVGDGASIKGYDPNNGKQRAQFDSTLGVSALATAFTLAADGNNLVTSNWFSNQVQVVASDSGAVLESYQDFAVPIDARRFMGDIVATELVTGSVSKKNADGSKTTIASGLYVPAGLASSGNNLFVTDWATGYVFQLVDNGATQSPPKVVAAGLALPEGIAVDEDGSLLVVETGLKRLVRINRSNGAVSVVETGLSVGLPGIPGYVPTHVFNGVTVGADGTIYVTEDEKNALVALHPRDCR